MDLNSVVQFPGGPDYTLESSYDLVGAAVRQSAFFYNVSLPHYKDSSFQNKAILRYKVRICAGEFIQMSDTLNE